MRATDFRFFLTISLCISAATHAQQQTDKRAGDSGKKPRQELSEDRSSTETQPKPGPEIERLVKAFSGTWSIAIKIEPNQKMPKGGKAQGEETWRPGPGSTGRIFPLMVSATACL